MTRLRLALCLLLTGCFDLPMLGGGPQGAAFSALDGKDCLIVETVERDGYEMIRARKLDDEDGACTKDVQAALAREPETQK